MFRNLTIRRWRQFEKIDLTFDDRLTVITGANGAGKTTLLSILTQHFGWWAQLLATPGLDRKGRLRYYIDYRKAMRDTTPEEQQQQRGIGSITYSDGVTAKLSVPTALAGPGYFVAIADARQVPGVWVSSHQPAHYHSPLTWIPANIGTRQELFNQYTTELRNRISPFPVPTLPTGQAPQYQVSPIFRMKEALVGLSVAGFGSQALEGRGEDAGPLSSLSGGSLGDSADLARLPPIARPRSRSRS